ncbi:hypothetical protein DAPPUDRAFT_316491 [Daphnia pulex]|uniref:Uncharacterized protein n=1 Tax=Daphnia pulex TaxID=6669 RepID=E9GD35_DAPPU|nr:hypothetical protein DAPPUDRAFT_316491 [Daphnia pulex]|eukprot:EFX82667.1 hypothetical protein DAPPUDRAFT_316491 [Daphnia pulex]
MTVGPKLKKKPLPRIFGVLNCITIHFHPSQVSYMLMPTSRNDPVCRSAVPSAVPYIRCSESESLKLIILLQLKDLAKLNPL